MRFEGKTEEEAVALALKELKRPAARSDAGADPTSGTIRLMSTCWRIVRTFEKSQ